MTQVLHGSCLCGATRYTVADEFRYALICLDARTLQPQAHIFVGSKAPWDVIGDSLPQHQELPSAS